MTYAPELRLPSSTVLQRLVATIAGLAVATIANPARAQADATASAPTASHAQAKAAPKKHRKARRAEEQSGIIEMPAPIHHSNVMLLDPKSGQPTRLRARIDEDGTKERLAVKSGESIPRSR